jgi:hypothetical protein
MVKQPLKPKRGAGAPKTTEINFSTRNLGVRQNFILNQGITGRSEESRQGRPLGFQPDVSHLNGGA